MLIHQCLLITLFRRTVEKHTCTSKWNTNISAWRMNTKIDNESVSWTRLRFDDEKCKPRHHVTEGLAMSLGMRGEIFSISAGFSLVFICLSQSARVRQLDGFLIPPKSSFPLLPDGFCGDFSPTVRGWSLPLHGDYSYFFFALLQVL